MNNNDLKPIPMETDILIWSEKEIVDDRLLVEIPYNGGYRIFGRENLTIETQLVTTGGPIKTLVLKYRDSLSQQDVQTELSIPEGLDHGFVVSVIGDGYYSSDLAAAGYVITTIMFHDIELRDD